MHTFDVGVMYLRVPHVCAVRSAPRRSEYPGMPQPYERESSPDGSPLKNTTPSHLESRKSNRSSKEATPPKKQSKSPRRNFKGKMELFLTLACSL